MYDYLNGVIEYRAEDYVTVDVNGVGYKVFTSLQSMEILKLGEKCKVFTFLHVREDDLVLFGFSSREELKMYKTLNSVNGVGPKASLALLSTYGTGDLAKILITKDVLKLTKAPGIGKKLAERIVLELKDKISTDEAIGFHGDIAEFENKITNDAQSEAVEALVSLGYTNQEAVNAILALPDRTGTVDVLIKSALRQLSSGGGKF